MEIKIAKNIKTFIEEHSPSSYSAVLVVPVLFLIFGFLIWNTYLYTFGVIEEDILRGQFIMTGFLFLFLSLLVVTVIDLIRRFLKWLYQIIISPVVSYINNKISKESVFKKGIKDFFSLSPMFKISFCITISFLWFVFYVVGIFPFIPAAMGGGQPRSISLLASEVTMPMLNSLGLAKGEGAVYQTVNVCVVNEDSQGVTILLDDRVLRIDHFLYNGFGSLPGLSAIAEQKCVIYAHNWSVQGLIFSSMLFETSFINLARSLIINKTFMFYYSVIP